MRKVMLSALLGFGTLGVTAVTPSEAKASWLSEAFDRSRIEVNVGPQYPVYAPAPVYPVYRPLPTYAPPAYGYYPVPTYPAYRPVYMPAPVVPVYRPAPSYVPQHSYYGPNRWDHDRDDHRDRDWRR